MTMEKGLALDHISITENGLPVLSVDAYVGPGEVLTIMGPSGSGKSTLLSYIVGSLTPDFQASGRVILDGHDITHVPPESRRAGILFQDDLLFPHMSVGANLAFGLRPGGDRVQRQVKIDAALAEVDMPGFADRDPSTLSGGQKARVALMRMLLAEPCALLLDEPFSRLDAGLRKQVRDMVFAKARVRQLPVLLVTHDAADAEAAGGSILTLSPPRPE